MNKRAIHGLGSRGWDSGTSEVLSRRRILLFLGATPLAGCLEESRPQPQPAFYTDLARPGATLDHKTAGEILNSYRRNASLAALVLDPALTAIAAREAERLALRGELEDGENRSLAAALTAGGFAPRQVRKSISGGYHSFADAFSGWRGAPHHDGVLRSARGRRYGLAAHHRPGARHRIYWVLLVSET